PYLHFYHSYYWEPGNIDGGIIEYSTNNGSTWIDASALFNAGKNYDGVLTTAYDNPLEGRNAFSSLSSNGFVSSRYNLTSLAGGNVRFRWRVGADSTGTRHGWVIDDVRIYTCEPAFP